MSIKYFTFTLLSVLIMSACSPAAPTLAPIPTEGPAQPQPTSTLPQPVVTAPPATATPAPVVVSTLPVPPTVPPTEAATGSINGWVFHDLCASEQPGTGCVQQPDGTYRANGLLDPGEPSIGGVKVTLSANACPPSPIARETTTIVTDLSYSFTGLQAGTYCVSIDPQRDQNAAALLPGRWTHPIVADGPMNITVNLNPGENKFNVNFGWDYQFLPAISTTPGGNCTYRAGFAGDVSVPDNSVIAASAPFIKIWRIRNDGTCTWGPGRTLHALTFTNGTQFAATNEVPLPADVPPGGVIDVSIPMVAPIYPGTYRSEWMLLVAQGPLVGVGRDGQTPLYVQIVVGNPPPNDGNCTYNVKFQGDVTIPDNSNIAPGATFLKTWRVRNDGTCTWGTGYRLHAIKFVGGNLNSDPTPIELPVIVRPGESADLSVSLVAPTVPGVYRSEWKLFVEGGTLIGVGANGDTPLFAQIIVGTNGSVQIAPFTLFTELKHVILAMDAPIFKGNPGDVSNQVNLMAAGQTLLVTGLSTDGSWWRVLCPGDVVGPCWLTTNPAVAQKSYLAPGTPIAPNAVETGVRYVYLNADVPVFGGEPGNTGNPVNTLFAGQTALVTGISADNQWFRVLCANDTIGNCWVTTNPQFTTPTWPGR
ncbi:MAG: NBR1-Ig-like domain-containing protein [Anaerolineae bacterium]